MLYEAKKWYKALTGHILKRSRHQEAKNLIFGLSARLCQLVSLIFPAEWIKKRYIEKIGWMDSKKKVNDNTIAPYFRSQLTLLEYHMIVFLQIPPNHEYVLRLTWNDQTKTESRWGILYLINCLWSCYPTEGKVTAYLQ